MKDIIKLENIGNLEVLENITNWSEIKNYVKIRYEKGDRNPKDERVKKITKC